MRRLNPTTIWLLGGLLVLLLLIILLTGRNRAEQDRLGDDQLNQTASAADPEKRCSAQRTYELIKRELFRQAAEVRGSDEAAFNRLAGFAVLRMDAPSLTSHDEESGAISCSGTPALDLPPGVAVAGGRRTLTANIGYSLRPAAEGGGDRLVLTNADAIITPLATLARVGQPAEDPLAPLGNAIGPAVIYAPGEEPGPAPLPGTDPGPVAGSNPSFNCGNARSRGEIAVCNDPRLGALDRQMADQFNSALSRADAEQRALLQRTRDSFLSYRDRCGSSSCIADSYRGRMREIADIMAGRWSPPR